MSRAAGERVAGAPTNAGWPAPVGALLAGLAVAAGAFGAHALRDAVAPERLAIFETAVRYQLAHGLGLLLVGALGPSVRAAAWPLLLGSAVFSGSLYALVLTDRGAWGAVAPVGGLLMIVGWGVLAWRLWRR